MITSKKKSITSKGSKKPVKTTQTKNLKKAKVTTKDLKTATAHDIENMRASTGIDASVDSLPGRSISDIYGKLYGVYPAVVNAVRDPADEGRVRVVFPSLRGDDIPRKYSQGGVWARLTTFIAGNNCGSWFIPDVGDEVLVAFGGGDIGLPYVIGSLWNEGNPPPVSMDRHGENNLKVLKSRNGVKITLDDTNNNESLLLETPAGQKISIIDTEKTLTIENGNGNSLEFGSHGITIKDSNANSLEFGSHGITIGDNDGNSLEFGPFVITISAPSSLKINTSVLEISAEKVKINSALTEASGVVKCATLITNSVVSSSYTPGAGNIW
jgi:uncharacterized protein involved in type VI secretion and phage assembly